jgi:triacylglycerol lipase
MGASIRLKYPIVFVHGIIAHDRTSSLRFWGRIPDTLRQKGAEVFFGNTDAWGVYESNARILKLTVEKALRATKKGKVNIIAHSKGGVDARYFIWKYGFGDRVASLTTVCTPHRGSELADLIYDKKIIHTAAVKKALALFGQLYGDLNPNLYNVNYQLTTRVMREFNRSVAADENVYYQSLYTVMERSTDDFLLFYPHRYLQKVSGRNDGMVSESSSRWGSRVVRLPGSLSHIAVVDVARKKSRKYRQPSGTGVPGLYVRIALELSAKGF